MQPLHKIQGFEVMLTDRRDVTNRHRGLRFDHCRHLLFPAFR